MKKLFILSLVIVGWLLMHDAVMAGSPQFQKIDPTKIYKGKFKPVCEPGCQGERGPAGPAGPEGPLGPAGPMGPPSCTGEGCLVALTFYVNEVEHEVLCPPDLPATGTIFCRPLDAEADGPLPAGLTESGCDVGDVSYGHRQRLLVRPSQSTMAWWGNASEFSLHHGVPLATVNAYTSRIIKGQTICLDANVPPFPPIE